MNYIYIKNVATVEDLDPDPFPIIPENIIGCYVESESNLYFWDPADPRWVPSILSKRDQILSKLQALKDSKFNKGIAYEGDPERDHAEADHLLLDLIDDPEITEAFKAIRKWYA